MGREILEGNVPMLFPCDGILCAQKSRHHPRRQGRFPDGADQTVELDFQDGKEDREPEVVDLEGFTADMDQYAGSEIPRGAGRTERSGGSCRRIEGGRPGI